MTYDYCSNTKMLKDEYGFPIYYYGAGPDNPENAKIFFCGPKCANKWFSTNQAQKQVDNLSTIY